MRRPQRRGIVRLGAARRAGLLFNSKGGAAGQARGRASPRGKQHAMRTRSSWKHNSFSVTDSAIHQVTWKLQPEFSSEAGGRCDQ